MIRAVLVGRGGLAALGTGLGLSTAVSMATVAGQSMYPTFSDEDRVLLERCTPYLGRCRRGDVVVLRSPESNAPCELLTKRIVALEGDWLYPRRGGLLQQVPTGMMWVEGDNAANSNDSNHFGPVPLPLIQSRAVAVVSPHPRLVCRDEGSSSRVICSDAASTLQELPRGAVQERLRRARSAANKERIVV